MQRKTWLIFHPSRQTSRLWRVGLSVCGVCVWPYGEMRSSSILWDEVHDIITFTFTFMHLADAFIQSDLHCIQVTVSTFYQHIMSAVMCVSCE